MNKCLALIALALLAACGQPAAPETPPLDGARMGGPFTLTDQNGQRVSDRAFAGQYRLIYFGYTFCPDVCPVDVQKLMAGFKAFEQADPARAKRVQPFFITVDPERDTPAVLKQFVSAFHPRLIGLTGSPEEIAATAKTFAAIYEKDAGPDPKAYLVNHSRAAVLYGPDGKPISLISQDGSADKIAAELKKWVR
jgi:protein SCO1